MNNNGLLHVSTGSSTKSNGCQQYAADMSHSESTRFLPSSSRAISKDMWSPCSDCSSDENNSPTALNSFRWDKPAMEDKSLGDFGRWTNTNPPLADLESKRPLSSGYVNLKTDSEDEQAQSPRTNESSGKFICQKIEERFQMKGNYRKDENNSMDFSLNSACSPTDFSEKMFEKSERRHKSETSSLHSSSSFLTPPSTPLGSESSFLLQHQKDLEDLKKVAWFQAGIPREIVLEVLASKPVGSFIVRESTTKPGCYALSLRVPPGKNPCGIAHYLIMHTNKGYKIKGFTKEFKNLEALITHHSVMPELLPCPLALPRFYNEHGHPRKEDDMDIIPEDEKKRCSVFSDIHWIMNDLHL